MCVLCVVEFYCWITGLKLPHTLLPLLGGDEYMLPQKLFKIGCCKVKLGE